MAAAFMLSVAAGALASDDDRELSRAYAAVCELVRPGAPEDGLLGCLAYRLDPETTSEEIASQVAGVCSGLDSACQRATPALRTAIVNLKSQSSSCVVVSTPHCGDQTLAGVPAACAAYMDSVDFGRAPQLALRGQGPGGDPILVGPTLSGFMEQVLSQAGFGRPATVAELQRTLGAWCEAYRNERSGPPDLSGFAQFLDETDRAVIVRAPLNGGGTRG